LKTIEISNFSCDLQFKLSCAKIEYAVMTPLTTILIQLCDWDGADNICGKRMITPYFIAQTKFYLYNLGWAQIGWYWKFYTRAVEFEKILYWCI